MQTPSTTQHSSPKPPSLPSSSTLRFPHRRYVALASAGFRPLRPVWSVLCLRCCRGWSSPGASLRANTWMCRWWLQTNSLSVLLWVTVFYSVHVFLFRHSFYDKYGPDVQGGDGDPLCQPAVHGINVSRRRKPALWQSLCESNGLLNVLQKEKLHFSHLWSILKWFSVVFYLYLCYF